MCLILRSYLATLVVIQTLLKHIGQWAKLHEVCDYDSKKSQKEALFLMPGNIHK